MELDWVEVTCDGWIPSCANERFFYSLNFAIFKCSPTCFCSAIIASYQVVVISSDTPMITLAPSATSSMLFHGNGTYKFELCIVIFKLTAPQSGTYEIQVAICNSYSACTYATGIQNFDDCCLLAKVQ
jgi:hypothetical protein